MKKTLTTILFSAISIAVFAQCNITTTKVDSDVAYQSNAEVIYKNGDLENGILTAYFQLVAIQNGKDKNLLKFAIITKVLSTGNKSALIPRKITFVFENNEKLECAAGDLTTTHPLSGLIQNECAYGISLASYQKLQSNKTNRIQLEDTRTGNIIIASPFNGLVQEQANCIANKL
jgi:hypothetical protein